MFFKFEFQITARFPLPPSHPHLSRFYDKSKKMLEDPSELKVAFGTRWWRKKSLLKVDNLNAKCFTFCGLFLLWQFCSSSVSINTLKHVSALTQIYTNFGFSSTASFFSFLSLSQFLSFKFLVSSLNFCCFLSFSTFLFLFPLSLILDASILVLNLFQSSLSLSPSLYLKVVFSLFQ